MNDLSVQTQTHENGIKVRKLQNGYGWDVSVAATGASLEELQEAKEIAVAISEELKKELLPGKESQAELPF